MLHLINPFSDSIIHPLIDKQIYPDLRINQSMINSSCTSIRHAICTRPRYANVMHIGAESLL